MGLRVAIVNALGGLIVGRRGPAQDSDTPQSKLELLLMKLDSYREDEATPIEDVPKIQETMRLILGCLNDIASRSGTAQVVCGNHTFERAQLENRLRGGWVEKGSMMVDRHSQVRNNSLVMGYGFIGDSKVEEALVCDAVVKNGSYIRGNHTLLWRATVGHTMVTQSQICAGAEINVTRPNTQDEDPQKDPLLLAIVDSFLFGTRVPQYDLEVPFEIAHVSLARVLVVPSDHEPGWTTRPIPES